jgi:hypothetical protein
MENVRSRTSPALALKILIGLLFSARGASAHGHDTENIKEGEYMSADPLVR